MIFISPDLISPAMSGIWGTWPGGKVDQPNYGQMEGFLNLTRLFWGMGFPFTQAVSIQLI